jgi:hypothetical protein
MAFVIQYLRDGAKVGESVWLTPIPPTHDYAQHSLALYEADTALILDEEGNEVAREKWHVRRGH